MENAIEREEQELEKEIKQLGSSQRKLHVKVNLLLFGMFAILIGNLPEVFPEELVTIFTGSLLVMVTLFGIVYVLLQIISEFSK